ncbi:hypothetical protein P691DRAFT_629185, partial [Macrolepiota fuliginosa MF-IS2]
LELDDPSAAYKELEKTWEVFIDSLIKERKTLNIVSALLVAGILTTLQIENAATDFYTRYLALFSFTGALISLLFGCVYVIQFSSMRKIYKEAEWAFESINEQMIFWNVWVTLSLPAVWLAWTILFFIAAIVCFMWRVSYTQSKTITLTFVHFELVPRILIYLLLVVGV